MGKEIKLSYLGLYYTMSTKKGSRAIKTVKGWRGCLQKVFYLIVEGIYEQIRERSNRQSEYIWLLVRAGRLNSWPLKIPFSPTFLSLKN